MRLNLSRFSRRRLALISVGTLAVAAAAVVPVLPAFAATSCNVTYTPAPWTEGPGVGGYTANITITNTGDAWTSWTLRFTLPSGQSFTQGWSANWTPSGTAMTATNMPWNGSLGTGQSTGIGFNGRWSGSYSSPTSFTVNNVTCNGGPPPTTTTTAPPPPPPPPPTSTPPPNQVPGTPGTLSASGTTATSTNLSWGASSGTVSNYQIERCQGASCTNFAQVGTSTTTSFTNTGLTAATTYRYRVRATNSVGNSGYSNIVNVTTTTTSTTTTTTSPPPGCQPNCPPLADNPFAGAQGYVNPDWSSKAAAEAGGSRISNTPTGIWLDTTGAIPGVGLFNGPNGDTGANGTSLDKHLRNAVALDAANGSTPVYTQFVIYNLPNRDCSALASNGQYRISQDGLNRYKTEYIDVIRSVISKPAYNNIRKVLIIEIDSLPNLITNTNLADCAEAQSSGAYVQGVQYALSQFASVANTYNYIDAAHHGWLGWDSNFGPAAQLFSSTAAGATGGRSTVTGFITNTANYSALSEPNFTINTTVNGQTVRQSRWVDWNFYIDELTFAQAFRTRLIQEGFPSNIGMLIDTSRNGWGNCTPQTNAPCQPNQSTRPTAPSTSTDLNTFVDQSRVDRRIHAGNWCNQAGAGLGERPRANPAAGIDAYVWIKPPGESDGSSSLIPTGPENPDGKGFDRMCDPTYGGNERNGNNATGALPNSPASGRWFSAQFQQLMRNAWPAL